jgi:hypothetical protein
MKKSMTTPDSYLHALKSELKKLEDAATRSKYLTKQFRREHCALEQATQKSRESAVERQKTLIEIVEAENGISE